MPDSPMEAKFLKYEDKLVAVERLRMNQMGIGSGVWKWDHVREAAIDTKTWRWFSLMLIISYEPLSSTHPVQILVTNNLLQHPKWWHFNIWPAHHRVVRLRPLHHHPFQHPLWRRANGCHARWRMAIRPHQHEIRSPAPPLPASYSRLRDSSRSRPRPKRQSRPSNRLLHYFILPRYLAPRILVVRPKHRRRHEAQGNYRNALHRCERRQHYRSAPV